MIDRPHPDQPNPHVDLAVVIVSYWTADLLRACLRALAPATAGLRSRVHVVDNDSPDGSAAMVQREFPDVELTVNAVNVGFPRANNLALARVDARYVVLLNPDTEPEPDSLRKLVAFMDAHPSVGACGPMLLNSDGSIQWVGGRAPTLWHDALEAIGLPRMALRGRARRAGSDGGHTDRVRQVDWVSGACLLVRTETMRQVGALDERFFMLYEEIEWCHRMRAAGWAICLVPTARVVHHLMGTLRTNDPEVARRLMADRLAHYRQSRRLYYQETAGPLTALAVRLVTVLEAVRPRARLASMARRALSRARRYRRA